MVERCSCRSCLDSRHIAWILLRENSVIFIANSLAFSLRRFSISHNLPISSRQILDITTIQTLGLNLCILILIYLENNTRLQILSISHRAVLDLILGIYDHAESELPLVYICQRSTSRNPLATSDHVCSFSMNTWSCQRIEDGLTNERRWREYRMGQTSSKKWENVEMTNGEYLKTNQGNIEGKERLEMEETSIMIMSKVRMKL